MVSGTVYGSGYDCRNGIIHDKRRFGKDGNYLPDGLWNNVSAHVDWINDLVEKNLTEAVRRDFEITKLQCRGDQWGDGGPPPLDNNLKVLYELHVCLCQKAGLSGGRGAVAAEPVVTRAPGRGRGNASWEAAKPPKRSATRYLATSKTSKAARYHNV